MAIQLNDRDHLIFKLVDEHEVLLEKHISWFIAGEEKPVLIRDRLRKLFYLDYLLCHRHGSKLPWWTTPTKPLVYMLSTMARTIAGAPEATDAMLDNEFQRHHLEVANLRMLYLVAQKDAQISQFQWTTCKQPKKSECGLDAMVTFKLNNTANSSTKLGLVNNLSLDPEAISKLTSAIENEKLDSILLISRDDLAQKALQQLVVQAGGDLAKRTLFATHQELYKDGIVATRWQGASGHAVRESEAAVAYIGPMTQPIAV
ncbi:MAG: hypothetical protein C0508_02710 [Cyanobacteria bacterium PR.023]|jgi:hypothetical protein|nr:hypothetical protein [Cyanobacteria bacterium PR.023]MDQ5934903.1 hypothetical protein [Cyanobacteriota bacterium erpe_2018_sw_21hr_WHONDRS-SW48-000092_B_bin.40]